MSANLVTVGLLIVLEALLSADNALVLAVLVLGLPKRERGRAMNVGMAGAFVLRGAATLLALWLIKLSWVKLAGGVYLFYLTVSHFRERRAGAAPEAPKARAAFGLSAFWATIVRMNLMNLAFSIDSILVAVAMSKNVWVVVSGGMLGMVALRVMIGQLLALIQRYPLLVDTAFVIIAWIGVKLVVEYAHQMAWIAADIPTWFSLATIGVIFGVGYALARRRGPQRPADAA